MRISYIDDYYLSLWKIIGSYSSYMNFLKYYKPFNAHFIFYLKNIWFFFKAKPLNHITEEKNGPNGDLYNS